MTAHAEAPAPAETSTLAAPSALQADVAPGATASAPPMPGLHVKAERRRPGRLQTDNAYLIQLMRGRVAPGRALAGRAEVRPAQQASFADSLEQTGQEPGFLPVVLAAVLFWAAALHLFHLI